MPGGSPISADVTTSPGWNCLVLAPRARLVPDCDVDLLVTFEEGQTPGFAFITICDELEACFGREVDVLTRESVESDFNPNRRRGILEKTEALYAA